MQVGYAYWLSAYDEEAVGGVYAQLYGDLEAQHVVAVVADGDLSRNEQFSLYYTPEISGIYYLRLSPNERENSALYNLFYRARVDTSSSESLGDALNAPSLEWQTSVDTGDPWYAQTDITHDGNGAVQSGNAYYNETSWIKTRVTESGTVGFWWKVSSVENRDYLTFFVDDEHIKSISGEKDWEYFSHYVEAHDELRWELKRSRGASSSATENAAWLDEFTLNPGQRGGGGDGGGGG
jgi:hypothetical protein